MLVLYTLRCATYKNNSFFFFLFLLPVISVFISSSSPVTNTPFFSPCLFSSVQYAQGPPAVLQVAKVSFN